MITSADRTSEAGSVFPAVAGFTRVCAYDRPGTATKTEAGFEPSRSTPVASPATAGDSADDLDLLLRASGEPGPYVLVGHSLGGPIVRLYAAAHPTEVAGLVLVDALSENLIDGLTAAQVESFELLNDPGHAGPTAGFRADPVLHGRRPPPARRAGCSDGADGRPHRRPMAVHRRGGRGRAGIRGPAATSSPSSSPRRSGPRSSRPRTRSPRSSPAPSTSPRPTPATTSTSTTRRS